MKYCIQLLFILVCYFGLAISQSPCMTPDFRQGSCIELRRCAQLFNMYLDPNPSLSDRNFLRRSQCDYVNSSERWVCCAPDDGIREPPSNQPTTHWPPPNKSTTSRPPSNRPTSTRPPNSNTRIGLSASDLPAPGVCGSSVDNRITFGETTQIQEMRWMALIEYTKPNGNKNFLCGGALINKDYVLTASHCVNGKGVTSQRLVLTGVRLGEWDTQSATDCDDGSCSDPVLDVPVVERITHENYNSNGLVSENDIALLRLARSITFTDWIKPICLPLSSELAGKNYDNAPLVVAGWGRTENGKYARTNSNLKLKAEVDGVSLNQCNNVYRQLNVVLTSKQLCAGGDATGRDSCRGDSGGPIMTKHNPDEYHTYYYLAGLVSFGLSPCGQTGWPGVYTRVDQYTDWILSHMRA